MSIHLSIVVAAFEEQENVRALIQRVGALVTHLGFKVEVIVVDDGSSDLTLARTRAMMTGRPWLRVLHLDHNYGQSAALAAGIRAAQGEWVATMDADLQIDPMDLAPLLDRAGKGDCDWAQGRRTPRVHATPWWRVATASNDALRRLILADGLADPSCSLRVFRREVGLQLPLQFTGLHRFMPCYALRLGYRVVEVPVREREREHGTTKYALYNEVVDSLFDLAALRWMFVRFSPGKGRELAITATAQIRAEEVSARSLDGMPPPPPV